MQKKKKNHKFYHILDSRVSEFIPEYEKDINYCIPDFEKYIMETDTDRQLLCKEINRGTYGNLCVLADDNGRIMFEYCKEDKWRIN